MKSEEPMFLDDEGRGLKFPLSFSPPFSWPGNKFRFYSKHMRWVEPHLRGCRVWVEPFAGGAGAMWWALREGMRPKTIHLSDAGDIRRFWKATASNTVLSSVRKANKHTRKARKLITKDLNAAHAFFAERKDAFNFAERRLSDFLYLIRNSFNCLVRFNDRGEFNASCGYTCSNDAKLVHVKPVESLLELLRTGTELIVESDWRDSVDFVLHLVEACGEDPRTIIVSIDPPYFPKSSTANFTEYAGASAFTSDDHKKLAKAIAELEDAGVKWLLHGNDEPEGVRVYKKTGVVSEVVEGVTRTIAGAAESKKPVSERVWYSRSWGRKAR